MNKNDKNIHEKFMYFGANAKEWMKKCILLLPEIDRRQIWAKKGFGSIYEYAAKLAGMSRGQVEDALRILRKIEDKPELRKVAEKKGINSIRPVVAIATKETEKFWADKAREMSKNTLSTYVCEHRKEKEIRTSPEKVTIEMNLESEIAQQLKKLKGSGNWNTLMKEFLKMRAEKFKEEKPKKVETESRHIPVAIKKYVVEKTNGQCAFPGCIKEYKILHHAKRFALIKEHDPDKIVPLCKAHHELAHCGLIENENKPSEFWKVRKEADYKDPKYDIDETVSTFAMR